VALNLDALDRICEQLERIARGEPVLAFPIGTLSAEQLELVNKQRAALGFPAVPNNLVFRGTHIYESRVVRNGYTIADVRLQIASAVHDSSLIHAEPRATFMQSALEREDGYGNRVFDRAVLGLSARSTRIEIYSVMPKGDIFKPRKQQAPHEGGA
jgi:hypothetical protein